MVAVCSKCGERPRLPGSRSTWCRECKGAWQREYRRRKGVEPRAVPMEGRLRDRLVREGDCLVYTGYRNEGGYGVIGRDGGRGAGTVLVHRAMYELEVGPIPDGLELDHLCENPPCCEPTHLEPVTHGENLRRIRVRRGTCPWGHPYDSARKDGTPRCLTCAREQNRRSRARRVAQEV